MLCVEIITNLMIASHIFNIVRLQNNQAILKLCVEIPPFINSVCPKLAYVGTLIFPSDIATPHKFAWLLTVK